MNKKALFLATENAEIFLDRIDTVFFRHGFTRIHTDSSIVNKRGYLWHKLHGFLSGLEIRDWLFENYHPLCSPFDSVQGRLRSVAATRRVYCGDKIFIKLLHLLITESKKLFIVIR